MSNPMHKNMIHKKSSYALYAFSLRFRTPNLCAASHFMTNAARHSPSRPQLMAAASSVQLGSTSCYRFSWLKLQLVSEDH